MNATVLPDGQVLVTGGTSGGGFDDFSAGAATRTPRSGTRPRTPGPRSPPAASCGPTTRSRCSCRTARCCTAPVGTRSWAALTMPDQRNHEIFSPPYLFKGARPTISNAPTSVGYGQTFTVATPNAAQVTEVRWIHIGSVTHAFDFRPAGQHAELHAHATGVNVTAPASPDVATPGHYMLFILNRNDVPSRARSSGSTSWRPRRPVSPNVIQIVVFGAPSGYDPSRHRWHPAGCSAEATFGGAGVCKCRRCNDLRQQARRPGRRGTCSRRLRSCESYPQSDHEAIPEVQSGGLAALIAAVTVQCGDGDGGDERGQGRQIELPESLHDASGVSFARPQEQQSLVPAPPSWACCGDRAASGILQTPAPPNVASAYGPAGCHGCQRWIVTGWRADRSGSRWAKRAGAASHRGAGWRSALRGVVVAVENGASARGWRRPGMEVP